MGLLEKLRLLAQFGDEALMLLAKLAEFQQATTVEAKAQVIVSAAKVIAVKTPSDIDDLALELVQKIFAAPEVVSAGKRLFDAIQRASQS